MIHTPHITHRRVLSTLLSAAVLALLAGCASNSGNGGSATLSTAGPASGASGARLYSGFGNYHREITTDSAQAQKWFDQAMQLLYGFNHDEAIRSFHRVAELDPKCAMAWWGIAYAHGLHINNPLMTEIQSQKAWDATQEALKRIEQASPVDRALIHAVSRRYAMPIPADRKPLDEQYAHAMQRVWNAYPNDPDVGALFAESMMNLQPWDLWTREYEPKGRTPEIVETLERVIAMRSDHPGGNHFYIHTMEASKQPEKALASADLLTTLVPGSGHLVHMPAHIYARLGRWGDASDSNVEAIKVDRAYFKTAPKPDFYSLYFVHNIHFLSWSACMEGRYATALKAARDLEKDIPQDFLRDWPQFADGFMPTTYHIMIRFGKWKEILAEPAPPEFRHVSRTMLHYARGVAQSALGNIAEAKAEVAAFEKEAALIPDDWQVGQNKAHDVVKVARSMLTGELAYREGRLDEAFTVLREGVVQEVALKYDEPPGWMQPVRHALGALMMGAGRPAEAEQVYRDDLEMYASNSWSLLGLKHALEAQSKDAEASALEPQLQTAWKRADVKPTSSCYCQPGK